MERYLCIHCHFYQPPRENPWLESIEFQESAEPYHDWNERVTAECYAPNAAARILNESGKISRIVNNYASVSFNFGPTLLSWMEYETPDIYESILEADKRSMERFSGHGNAIAQAFNHLIMPLANMRDRYTQVNWGLRDFERRFGRTPEGCWLPETACDIDSLEVLSDLGIKYTILAPHQAGRTRKVGGARFINVEGGRIDPTRPYVCRLPSGREISLFFYDGPISRAVAFEGLLSNGERFAARLLGGFSESRKWPQLMHIATDGETYGHHHKHGEMALAYTLHYIEEHKLAQITNYGEFLDRFPPTYEAEIINNTSWSCAHGVERWRSDCGCNSGMKPGWKQHWRAPLRNALDVLRDSLAKPFEEEGGKLLKDPWAARDAYINVVLDRKPNLPKFFEEHSLEPQDHEQKVRTLKLLEMQRHLMLMYTSCGWFFDELSGLETVQVILYASRALQLARDLFGDDYETLFLQNLTNAHSNIGEYGSGADIYNRWVRPAEVDLQKVTAHYAIVSMFERLGNGTNSIYCYDLQLHDDHRLTSGRAQLSIGRATVCSRITLEKTDVSFGALHFGDHNINAGVRPFKGQELYDELVKDATSAFRASDLPLALRQLDRHFEGVAYSVRSLFRDERRIVLRQLLGSTMQEAENSLRLVYEHHAPLMGFLVDIHARVPNVLRFAAEFVVNAKLRHEFEESDLSIEQIQLLLESARRDNINLDESNLAFIINRRLDRIADELLVYPHSESLEQYKTAVTLVRSLPFEVDLWKMQNAFYRLMQNLYPDITGGEGSVSERWTKEFEELGALLNVDVPRREEIEEEGEAEAPIAV